MRIKVPRLALNNQFVLREGDLNAWYGFMLEQATGPSDDYHILIFDGECKYCSPGVGAQEFCHGTRSWYKGTSNKRTFHCGLVIYESDSPTISFEAGDSANVSAFVGNHYYRASETTATGYECVECLPPYGDWTQYDLDNLPEVILKLGSYDYKDFSLTYLGEVAKKWFRDLWNTYKTPYAPNQPVPIEPTEDRFVVFYGLLAELMSPLTYERTGWCHPWGGNCGMANPSCYKQPAGPPAPGKYIGDYNPITGPTRTFPFIFKHNGAVLGQYPGTAPIDKY